MHHVSQEVETQLPNNLENFVITYVLKQHLLFKDFFQCQNDQCLHNMTCLIKKIFYLHKNAYKCYSKIHMKRHARLTRPVWVNMIHTSRVSSTEFFLIKRSRQAESILHLLMIKECVELTLVHSTKFSLFLSKPALSPIQKCI